MNAFPSNALSAPPAYMLTSIYDKKVSKYATSRCHIWRQEMLDFSFAETQANSPLTKKSLGVTILVSITGNGECPFRL